MKAARENISNLTSHDTLKRLMVEYENFDTASMLCVDYCITAEDIARLIDGITKSKKSKSKSRLKFVMRADKTIDIREPYLLAR
jgi:hypothetical protein